MKGVAPMAWSHCIEQDAHLRWRNTLWPSHASQPSMWPCSILYQRGVYPPEDFEPQKQYGLTMMVSTEPGIKKYLCSVLEQMSGVPPLHTMMACCGSCESPNIQTVQRRPPFHVHVLHDCLEHGNSHITRHGCS